MEKVNCYIINVLGINMQYLNHLWLNGLTHLNLHCTKLLNLYWLLLDVSTGYPFWNLIHSITVFISKTTTYVVEIPQYYPFSNLVKRKFKPVYQFSYKMVYKYDKTPFIRLSFIRNSGSTGRVLDEKNSTFARKVQIRRLSGVPVRHYSSCTLVSV